ncbi:dienelactone hydrolase family protein [Epibacterium ulvae]|uniref:alpha/beta hydrolase family protein n=1 Tax=Epibacterium ulvae TaxID=1156985 RepID=UPI001BFC3B5F|nr:dienelactone hydrolase family protein [Epibacterium ulvae]MBT8154397.1 dienelactone hydrolase family protein [Epibacterium ulvae]
MSKAIYYFALLAALTYVTLQVSPKTATSETALLPPAQPAGDQLTTGSYAKVRRATIQSQPLADYTYTPSEHVKDIAVKNKHQANTWYHYAPDGTSPAPLVILFHGSGRDGLSVLDMWKDVAAKEDLILLAPNARGRSWETSDFTLSTLNKMLEITDLHRPVDRDRIYLFGHSNGGGFVTLLVNRFDGPWKAGVTHGGFASSEHISAQKEAKPFRIYLGEKDHIFGVDAAEQTARAMARAGHSVTLQLIPNHTHWLYKIGPRIARDSWAWFRTLTP